MEYTTTIVQLRTYLKQWFLASEPPKYFMGKQIYENSDHIDTSEVVYLLGKITYYHLTHTSYMGLLENPMIIRPRLYQFLSSILQENPNERITEPEILLQRLTAEKRDSIEEVIENEEYRVECYSTIGVTRTKNQDYLSSFTLSNGSLVLMVADGMGGGEAGEIASKMVIEYLKKYLHSILLTPSSIEEQLRTGVFNAHNKIITYIKEHKLKSMGSTLSMTILFPNGELYIAHIGDSRIYEKEQQGELRQLSEDHSYPEVLFRLGKISEEEKENYQKNIVVYILGKESLKKEEICIYKSYLYSDTELLLCSDGFWDMIPINKETFTQSFDTLKKEIFQQVSKDNVTVIRYKPKKNLKEISKVSTNGEY